MEPINENILPSHEVLRQLATMHQFGEDQGVPQLFIQGTSVEVKVKSQAKSRFESWTSKEDWQDFLNGQKPGLKNLPYLLDRTITELKLELVDVPAGEYKLAETIMELELAYGSLNRVRSFKSLDNTTLAIINKAMTDILKLQDNLTKKYKGKDVEPSKELGFTGYIPKIILGKIGKIDEKNQKEAEEIVGNLQLLLKNEISIKTFIKLKSILEDDKDPSLKSAIKKCFKGDMTAFDTFKEISPENWFGVSYVESLEIRDLLCKLFFKSFIETSDTGLKLKNLINSDFQFSVGMTEQTARNLLDEEKHNLLNQFLECYQSEVIDSFLQNLPRVGEEITLKNLKDAIQEFNMISDDVELKTIHQFKADYMRTFEFEREDAYHKIMDEKAVPNNFQNLDERLKFAAKAIEDLCLPNNAHNQKFIPVIQMAVTQMSLGDFGNAEGSFHPSYFYNWSDGTNEFRWETTNNSKIKIEVIHDSLGDIEKVNVKIKGGVQIIQKNTNNELDTGENKIVIKDAIIVKSSYSLKFDNDGAIQIEDYVCKYDISLK